MQVTRREKTIRTLLSRGGATRRMLTASSSWWAAWGKF